MLAEREQKKLSILHILKQAQGALNSADIADFLRRQGLSASERTVRLYLKEMDGAGLTKNFGKRGRMITEHGLSELNASHTMERVGILSAKIDQMTYRMTFDLALRTGTVVVNTTIVERGKLEKCLDKICRVFEKNFAMGNLVSLLDPGEQLGDLTVPKGMIGFCTVCGITLNGVMLKHGVPVNSRFGGLLEVRDGTPTRFVELITYDGTTIDPLEVFIRSAMTDYLGAISTGNGKIGASFREIPAESRPLVATLAEKVDAVGLGGFMELGLPGRPLLGIPVTEGRAGAIVIGGLNPSAVFEELGIRVHSRALSGMLEFQNLFPYHELKDRL